MPGMLRPSPDSLPPIAASGSIFRFDVAISRPPSVPVCGNVIRKGGGMPEAILALAFIAYVFHKYDWRIEDIPKRKP